MVWIEGKYKLPNNSMDHFAYFFWSFLFHGLQAILLAMPCLIIIALYEDTIGKLAQDLSNISEEDIIQDRIKTFSLNFREKQNRVWHK